MTSEVSHSVQRLYVAHALRLVLRLLNDICGVTRALFLPVLRRLYLSRPLRRRSAHAARPPDCGLRSTASPLRPSASARF